MSGIFISYRRQDAAGYAGRLRSDLAQHYGDEGVFFDVADIVPGSDWSGALHDAVGSADVILVVIGPQWLSATDRDGRRRIDDPQDFIRSEVAGALRLQDKRVVPVLVGGAQMPAERDLPADIRTLAYRQGLVLSDLRWDADLDALLRDLGVPKKVGRPPRPVPSAPTQPLSTLAKAPRSAPFLARLGMAFDLLLGRSVPAEPAPAPTSAVPEVAPRHDIFVSYASADVSFVDELVGAIEAKGRRCWIAHRDIPPGVPAWSEPIVTAIASSRLVLVLLTEHSIASVEVLREVTLAADEKIPLLPVSLDATPLGPGLRYFFVAGQRLDLSAAASGERVRRILPALDLQFAPST